MNIVPEHINTHTKLGRFGEEFVWRELRAAGYTVEGGKAGAGDLVVNGVVIEVKTAAQNHDGKYRFCLYRAGHTNHRNADIVVFLCCSNAGLITTFVIPLAALAAKDHVCFPKLRGYRGMYAEYRKPIAEGIKRWIC